MTTTARRLAALEEQFAPVDPHTMTDLDRDWFIALNCSPWIDTLRQFAGILAERRCLHTAAFPAGMRSGHCGDWREAFSQDERDARTQAELERLVSLAAVQGDEAALSAWIETADREGWPPLGGITFQMDRTGFDTMVTRRRGSIDVSRGCDMPGAEAWRRAHPQWHPGMAGDDALSFEVELLAEAGESTRCN